MVVFFKLNLTFEILFITFNYSMSHSKFVSLTLTGADAATTAG